MSFHYIIRAQETLLNVPWDKVTGYWDYTHYKSVKFKDVQEMVNDYKALVQRYDLKPCPMFFYKELYMPNSDQVYYGYEDIRTGTGVLTGNGSWYIKI